MLTVGLLTAGQGTRPEEAFADMPRPACLRRWGLRSRALGGLALTPAKPSVPGAAKAFRIRVMP